jgi:hypothetical protein
MTSKQRQTVREVIIRELISNHGLLAMKAATSLRLKGVPQIDCQVGDLRQIVKEELEDITRYVKEKR